MPTFNFQKTVTPTKKKKGQADLVPNYDTTPKNNYGGGGASRTNIPAEPIRVGFTPQDIVSRLNANERTPSNEYGISMNAPSYVRAAVAANTKTPTPTETSNAYALNGPSTMAGNTNEQFFARYPWLKTSGTSGGGALVEDTLGGDKPDDTTNLGGGADLSSLGYRTYNFTPSDTYVKAMAYTNGLLQRLSEGRTNYTDKINSMMDAIANRGPLNYDPDTDTLFQNRLAGGMNAGQVAMQDTMGQAAALTGGYGSTYATSAANQAYNGFIQDAYSDLPEYYQLAMDAYNQETQNMYNQLGILQTADDTEYSRLANAYASNAQAAAQMYDQEYNNYWQSAGMNESNIQRAENIARDDERYKAEQAAAAAAAQAENDYKWAKLYGDTGVYIDQYGGLAQDTSVKSSSSVNTKKTDNDMKEVALQKAISGGTDEGSEYYNYLLSLEEKGYDTDTLDALIMQNEEYQKAEKKRQKKTKSGSTTNTDWWNFIPVM